MVHVLKARGFEVRRGQQYCGGNGDADVVGIEGLHIECKRVEKINLQQALDQARNDARLGEVPVVMHRKNKEEWKVTMAIADFLELWRLHNDKVSN